MRNLGHTFIENNLTPVEYEEFDKKLEGLSLSQLKELMDMVGISYNPKDNWTKDDCIGVLDEAYWDEFDQAFRQITGRGFND